MLHQPVVLPPVHLQGAAIVPPFSISPATEVDSASDAETADRDDLSSFPN